MGKSWRDLLVLISVPLSGGGTVYSTGLPVAPDRILTARHGLYPKNFAPDGKIHIQWFHQPVSTARLAADLPRTAIVWHDKELDAALLECSLPEELPFWRCLSPSRPTQKQDWDSEGFPLGANSAGGDPQSFPFSGTTQGAATKSKRFHLDLLTDFQTRTSWGGVSGAPVIVNDRVAGVIVSTPTSATHRLTAVFAAELLGVPGFRKKLGYRFWPISCALRQIAWQIKRLLEFIRNIAKKIFRWLRTVSGALFVFVLLAIVLYSSDSCRTAEILALLGSPQVCRDLLADGSQGPAMVVLSGGRYLMGSPRSEPERNDNEGPRREVDICSFAIGETELPFFDYARFIAAKTGQQTSRPRRENLPVVEVSWQDAVGYADWLTKETGHSYRLPSEAEWEYAARAGSDTPFWTGKCINSRKANYDSSADYNSCGVQTDSPRGQPIPVGGSRKKGLLPPNPWGLYEVAGNVEEWVADCYDSHENAPNDGAARPPRAGDKCSERVVRGGHYNLKPGRIRSASRTHRDPDKGYPVVGFRLSRDLGPYSILSLHCRVSAWVRGSR